MFQLPRRRVKPSPSPDPARPPGLPDWVWPLLASEVRPARQTGDGDVLVWEIKNDASQASISDQFKAHAEDYHLRYAASDHFERLFRQAMSPTGLAAPPAPMILDLGSGSGVNSVMPCRRLFPGARVVATDLSGELLEILAHFLRQQDAQHEVACIMMDAMGDHLAHGQFDLVTGASILHHLDDPERGLRAAARALRPGGQAIFFEPFHGWSIMRLAYERILAEAQLRNDPLDPAVAAFMSDMVRDVAGRNDPAAFAGRDDKWLFSRARVELAAWVAGFANVRFVPHNDHPTLYRDAAMIQFRLATGRPDFPLADWALAVLDSFDAALPREVKREIMLEGTIVLTMPGCVAA